MKKKLVNRNARPTLLSNQKIYFTNNTSDPFKHPSGLVYTLTKVTITFTFLFSLTVSNINEVKAESCFAEVRHASKGARNGIIWARIINGASWVLAGSLTPVAPGVSFIIPGVMSSVQLYYFKKNHNRVVKTINSKLKHLIISAYPEYVDGKDLYPGLHFDLSNKDSSMREKAFNKYQSKIDKLLISINAAAFSLENKWQKQDQSSNGTSASLNYSDSLDYSETEGLLSNMDSVDFRPDHNDLSETEEELSFSKFLESNRSANSNQLNHSRTANLDAKPSVSTSSISTSSSNISSSSSSTSTSSSSSYSKISKIRKNLPTNRKELISIIRDANETGVLCSPEILLELYADYKSTLPYNDSFYKTISRWILSGKMQAEIDKAKKMQNIGLNKHLNEL